jgi:hypothetical protein
MASRIVALAIAAAATRFAGWRAAKASSMAAKEG